MQMKFFLIIIFCLKICISYTQSIVVEYSTVVIDDVNSYCLIVGNELLTTQDESVYSSFFNKDTIVNLSDGSQFTFEKNLKRGAKIYKDIANKKITSYETSVQKVVIDTTYFVEWKLTEKTKNIKGYLCQEAKGYYRGRDYTIYFSSEIPYKSGPYRFDNLPGLVLEVKSDDGVVNIDFVSLKYTEEKVENPFLKIKKTTTDWDGFILDYNKLNEKYESYSGRSSETVTENGSTVTTTNQLRLPRWKIEKLIY